MENHDQMHCQEARFSTDVKGYRNWSLELFFLNVLELYLFIYLPIFYLFLFIHLFSALLRLSLVNTNCIYLGYITFFKRYSVMM